MIHDKPAYAQVELKIEPAEPEDFVYPADMDPDRVNRVVIGGNVIVYDMDQSPNFMILYNEFKRRMKRKKISSIEDRTDRANFEKLQHSPLEPYKVIRGESHGNAVVWN